MSEKLFVDIEIGEYIGQIRLYTSDEDYETYDGEDILNLINGLSDENEQLKTQIKIFEKFLNENNLDIDWEIFCTVDECKKDSDDYGCKECKYLGDVE